MSHFIRDHTLRESGDVLCASFDVFGIGELAHVDRSVAAATHGSLLKADDLSTTLIGSCQRSPQAGTAIANDQEVALVVPSFGQPIGRRCGLVCVSNRLARDCRSTHHRRRTNQKVPTRAALLHLTLLYRILLTPIGLLGPMGNDGRPDFWKTSAASLAPTISKSKQFSKSDQLMKQMSSFPQQVVFARQSAHLSSESDERCPDVKVKLGEPSI